MTKSWVVIPILLFSSYLTSSGDEATGPKIVPQAAFTKADESRIKLVLAGGWNLKDAGATSYAVLTHAIFKWDVPKAPEVCKFLQSKLDGEDGVKLEQAFAISSAITKIPSCKNSPLKQGLKDAVGKTLKDGGTSQDIFYAAEISKAAGLAVDGAKVGELLKASTKADDSPSSLGYALWASAVHATKKDLLWDRIEDVVAQADEVDKKYLQFEGGLSVTGPVVSGIFRVGQAANKLNLTPDQTIKLGNYLVSRKTVTSPRGVWLFASALDVLSSNKFSVPVYIGVADSNILSEGNKVISVRASDLLGRPLDISLQLESVSHAKDGKKVPNVEFIQAVQAANDRTLFEIDTKTRPLPKGFFKITFVPKSTKGEKALVLRDTALDWKVVGKLGAVKVRVGVSDPDQQSKATYTDINRGEKLKGPLEVEGGEKLIIKIAASDSLHQVFVLLRNKATKREVAFIAQTETDTKTDYKLELDPVSHAKDLGYESGAYEVLIYLGDFLIEDSVEWALGEVVLQVAGGKAKSVNPLYAVSYGPKENIKHTFRVPEPRPPRVLSDAFTAFALAPLLILFFLWWKVGANVRGLELSLSALGFHAGLVGIFGVYGVFWLKLTMFEALKWMAVPGLVTFVSGHRLLSSISERRK